MRQQNIERYRFNFNFDRVKFEVFYFIDESPHILTFCVIAHNYYFEIPVQKGFQIRPFIEKYKEFCRVMGFTYNPDSPFSTMVFFEHFNHQTPHLASRANIPKPRDIAAVYGDKIEEHERIYFVCWIDNERLGHNVSETNLEKTRKLISYEAYLRCKNKNISSRWSPNPSAEKNITLPN